MALTSKLTAIADAIRAKTGDSAKLSLDDMPTAIEGIETGGGGGGYKLKFIESMQGFVLIADGTVSVVSIGEYENVMCFIPFRSVSKNNSFVGKVIDLEDGYESSFSGKKFDLGYMYVPTSDSSIGMNIIIV